METPLTAPAVMVTPVPASMLLMLESVTLSRYEFAVAVHWLVESNEIVALPKLFGFIPPVSVELLVRVSAIELEPSIISRSPANV